MAKLGDLVARIGADTKGFNKALGDVQRRSRQMSGNIKNVGKQMSMSITGPLALIGASSVKTFMSFEAQMAKVKAVSGATADEFSRLEANAKQLGASTRFSASEVAELQTEFAKLGFTADEITKVTAATLALAQATDSDLARAAEVAGSTLRGFGLDASETGRVADVMALSFSSSALDMEAFAESMKYVAPVANSAGMSIEQTTAMLGALSNAGIKGSQAGTALRRIISELGATGGDVAGAIENLAKKGLNLADAKDEVGRSAQSALLILLKEIQTVGQLETSFNNAAGSANKMSKIMDETADGGLARMNSAIEAAQISLGQALAPAVTKVMNLISNLASRFAELGASTQKAIAIFGGFAAAIGPILYVLPQIVAGFNVVKLAISRGLIPALKRLYATLLANPYLAIIAAVGALVLAFKNMLDKQFEVYRATRQANQALREQSAILSRAGKGAAGAKSVEQLRQGISALNQEIDKINVKGLTDLIDIDLSGPLSEIKIKKGIIDPTTEKKIKEDLQSSLSILSAEAARKGLFGDDAAEYVKSRAQAMAEYIVSENKAALVARRDELEKALNEATQVDMPEVNTGGMDTESAAVRVPIKIEAIDPLAVSEIVNEIPTPELKISATVEIDDKKISAFKEQATEIAGAVSGAFTQMGQKIVAGLGLADEGFEGFAKSLSGTVIELMGMYLSQSIAAAIAGGSNAGAATGPAAPATTPAFIATLVGGVLSAFAAIPAFADGGVVSGPTMGLMGEYSGARNNPEVIAPLDKLRGMIADVSGDGNGGGVLSTRVKGSDLVFVLERGQKQVNRNR